MRSGRPRGPGKALKKVGSEAPHSFEGLPGHPGLARLQKRIPQNPDRECLALKKREQEHDSGIVHS